MSMWMKLICFVTGDTTPCADTLTDDAVVAVDSHAITMLLHMHDTWFVLGQTESKRTFHNMTYGVSWSE